MMDLSFSNIFPVSKLVFGNEVNYTKRFANNLFHVYVKLKGSLKPQIAQISQIKIKDIAKSFWFLKNTGRIHGIYRIKYRKSDLFGYNRIYHDSPEGGAIP